MRLLPEELIQIADELGRVLRDRPIQGVFVPSPRRLYLEVRCVGETVTLAAVVETGVARLSRIAARPPSPSNPQGLQAVLRRELVGARISSVEALLGSRVLLVRTQRARDAGAALAIAIAIELGTTPGIALLGARNVVVALSPDFRDDLVVGDTWVPPSPTPYTATASRIVPGSGILPIACGAEALFATTEAEVETRLVRAPLERELKRLLRTIEKVRAESDRTAAAQAFLAEGELLKHNQGALRRGMTEVDLREVLASGEVRTVHILLSPTRTPAQEIAHRFNQYRRLQRGAAIATERLALLEVRARGLRSELDGGVRANRDAATNFAAPRARKTQPRAMPYRSYLGHGGQPIWVGRGAARNDALTFGVALPFHTWMHARGVAGAHVVVPLGKNRPLTPEVLLDAAHLAIHFSSARGEPKGEVSYVPVSRLRKGNEPGLVWYSQEKTIMVRVETDRLKRLLAANSAESA